MLLLAVNTDKKGRQFDRHYPLSFLTPSLTLKELAFLMGLIQKQHGVIFGSLPISVGCWFLCAQHYHTSTGSTLAIDFVC